MIHKQAGFNLIEVLLVLVIAGLLLGSVATALTSGPVLRTAARDVLSSLRHARSLALMRQQPILWSMDIEKKRYWVNDPKKNKKKEKEIHDSLTLKVNTAASEISSNSQGNIRFFPDGSSTGGSVEISKEDQTYIVNVEWISGRISIQ